MAIQIIDDPSKYAASRSVGDALSTGLQNLVSHKLTAMQEQRQRQQTMQGLQALGYNAQQSAQLSNLDPQSLQQVVKQKLAEPGERAYASALGSLLGEQPQQQPNLPSNQQSLAVGPTGLSDKQKEQVRKHLESPKGKIPYSPEYINKLQSHLDRPESIVQPEQASQVQAPILGGLNAKQAEKIAELGLKKQELSRKEKVEAFKLSKDERRAIIDAGKSARQNLHDLDRMEDLEKEGKLDTPGYLEFLKRSGLDVPALMDEGSQEYQKIAQTFLRDAKTYLGSRISNFELEQFLKTIPSLSQSPEGRKRVISNLKRFNRISLEYSNALKSVIKENKGIPPLDLLEQVDDKVEKKMDHYADLFKKDLARPVAAPQNRLITAAQSTAGSILGAPAAIINAIAGRLGGH